MPLYPASMITAVYCDPATDGDGDLNRGPFVITFTSPAPPSVVHDWLFVRWAKGVRRVVDERGKLTGDYVDGASFELTLAPHGDHQTDGVVSIAGLRVD